MQIKTNELFDELIQIFNINDITKIYIDIPIEVKEILGYNIVENKNGISLDTCIGILPNEYETASIIEDDSNHFHVDWYIDPKNEEQAFKLGILTKFMLALKFKKEEKKNIEFSYSFHTIEMAKQMSLDSGLTYAGEYHYGDRINFHSIREGEMVWADIELFKQNAILIVEI